MLFLPGGSVHDGRVRLHAAGCLKNLFDMRIRTFILAVAVFLTFGAGMACAQEARRMPSDSVMTGGRDGSAPVEHHFSLFTNVADWSHFGTMNASFLYSVSRRSTVGATLRYNPFRFGRGGGARMYKMRAAEVNYRFWPWHVYSGWWMLADAQAREYNRANIWGMDYDEQGWAVGAGLGFGYTYMLSDRWNVEGGVSVWGGYKDYKRYECADCGRLVRKGAKPFFEPDRVFVNLVYVF